MTMIYIEMGSSKCANVDGAPDVLYPGDFVELREKLAKQKLVKGQRAIVEKIYAGRKIRILPLRTATAHIVRVKDVYKLDWGN